jgi:hypothetical protein
MAMILAYKTDPHYEILRGTKFPIWLSLNHRSSISTTLAPTAARDRNVRIASWEVFLYFFNPKSEPVDQL